MAKEPSEKVSSRPAKKSPVLKLVMWGLLATAAAGGLGYMSYTLWQQKGDLEEEVVQKASAADACEKSLTGANDRVATATEDYASCKEEVGKLESVKANIERLEKNLKASSKELEELRVQREQAEKRLEAFRNLTDKLRSMIDSGQLDVVTRKGRMLVELPAEVMFASGKADLSEDGRMALMKVAVILEQFPDRQFMVAGHTDAYKLVKSKYASNWELSTARAVTVTEFLVKAGLKPTNLIAAGYGEFDPIASNKDKKGRQKNRRIEIVLMPSIEELPSIPEDLMEEGKAAGGDKKVDGKKADDNK